MNAAPGYHHHVFRRVAAGVDGPEDLPIVEDIHVLVDRDRYLGMKDGTGKDPHQHLLRLAVKARRHLHDDAEQPGQHQYIMELNVAADVFDVVVDRDAERDFVKDASFDLGAVLDRFEDGVAAPGDAVDLDHGVLSHAGDIVIVKL